MANSWNELISKLPNPHFLQTYEWGQVKAKYGWEPIYLVWDNEGKMKEERDANHLSSLREPPGGAFVFHPTAAALILKRQITRNGFAARLSILYSPKGPLLDWIKESLRTRVLNDLQSFAKKQGAVFLKMDPDIVLGTGVPDSEEDVPENNGQVVMSELKRRGWEYASDQIQFKNTVLIDLAPSRAATRPELMDPNMPFSTAVAAPRARRRARPASEVMAGVERQPHGYEAPGPEFRSGHTRVIHDLGFLRIVESRTHLEAGRVGLPAGEGPEGPPLQDREFPLHGLNLDVHHLGRGAGRRDTGIS